MTAVLPRPLPLAFKTQSCGERVAGLFEVVAFVFGAIPIGFYELTAKGKMPTPTNPKTKRMLILTGAALMVLGTVIAINPL